MSPLGDFAHATQGTLDQISGGTQIWHETLTALIESKRSSVPIPVMPSCHVGGHAVRVQMAGVHQILHTISHGSPIKLKSSGNDCSWASDGRDGGKASLPAALVKPSQRGRARFQAATAAGVAKNSMLPF